MRAHGLRYASVAALVFACGASVRPDCATAAAAGSGQPVLHSARSEHPAPNSAAASPCESESTSLAIESCVGQELEALETDLDDAINDLDRRLRSRNSTDAISALMSSQADWEKFRDSHCSLPTLIAGGGSLSGVDSTFCRRGLTAQRLEQIRALRQGIVE
jgi:uncharacterized protein YecT (DUF1311 family)